MNSRCPRGNRGADLPLSLGEEGYPAAPPPPASADLMEERLSGRRGEVAASWARQNNLQEGRVRYRASIPFPGLLGELRPQAVGSREALRG